MYGWRDWVLIRAHEATGRKARCAGAAADTRIEVVEGFFRMLQFSAKEVRSNIISGELGMQKEVIGELRSGKM